MQTVADWEGGLAGRFALARRLLWLVGGLYPEGSRMSACTAAATGGVVVPFPRGMRPRPVTEPGRGTLGLWLGSAAAVLAAHAGLAMAIFG